jgi:RNase P subunit RPR2
LADEWELSEMELRKWLRLKDVDVGRAEVIVTCAFCGTRNRLPQDGPSTVRCERCDELLPERL